MTVQIKDILEIIEADAPEALAESWDNVGLLVGDRERQIKHILVSLDPSSKVIDEAIDIGADAVISHHPVIFRPVSAIDTSQPTGKIIEKALKNSISIIGCHTNLDNAANSVSKILAQKLQLQNLSPLLPGPPPDGENTGTGCLGHFDSPLRGDEFLQLLLRALDLPALTLAGELPEKIEKIALCGGSGSGFTEAAFKSGADLYITSEVKHDIARWVEEYSFCIIDAGHYATEQFAVPLIADFLKTAVEQNDWTLEITETKTEKNPFSYIKRNDF